MEDRNNVTSIIKSNDPEKLKVFFVESLENEIRFYLNKTQYIAAIEREEGCKIILGENNEEKTKELNDEYKISIIKKNIKKEIKKLIKLLFFLIGIYILVFICLLYLFKITNNILVLTIMLNIVYFVIVIVSHIIISTIKTTPAVRSKHSAEHMMASFLEINKRLPKNIEEVKKISRFTPKCGSRFLSQDAAEKLVTCIVATIFAVIIGLIVPAFSNFVINVFVLLSIYLFVKFVTGKAITNYCALTFIINPIKKLLTYIAQCGNTTSKVKDKDIILAYAAAKVWLQTVYPEFYNENEDVFCKQYFKS